MTFEVLVAFVYHLQINLGHGKSHALIVIVIVTNRWLGL